MEYDIYAAFLKNGGKETRKQLREVMERAKQLSHRREDTDMIDWTKPNNIRARANAIRSEAEADKRIADMRIQFAVTLEDIAAAWEKSAEQVGDTVVIPLQPWLLWGNKVKCPYCGKVQDQKTYRCSECGKVVL